MSTDTVQAIPTTMPQADIDALVKSVTADATKLGMDAENVKIYVAAKVRR